MPKSLKASGAKASAANMKDDVTGEPLMQRSDDKPEALKSRLEGYHKMTMPILAHYRPRGVVHTLDATQKPSAVWNDLEMMLGCF